MNCNPKNDSNTPVPVVEEVTYVDIEEDVDAPPPGLVSKYKSMEEWLTHTCETENPRQQVDIFHFGIFDSPGNYTLYLVGLDSYKNGDTTGTRISFKPADMYFRLPAKEFDGLSREQLFGRLKSQLNAFLGSASFKNCFLAKARSITSDYME